MTTRGTFQDARAANVSATTVLRCAGCRASARGTPCKDLNQHILPLALISANMFLPHTLTDGVARIFSLTPMPRLGIELMSAHLLLFEGP